MIDPSRFFEGLKVLELSSVLAGPAVGMFFAELGAKVIKIENARTGGDVTRHWKLPSEDKDSPYSAYYCSVNYRKEVHLLDLKMPDARAQVYELAKSCDIVLSNFKPESALEMGLAADDFRNLNPRIIYAYLTGFGDHSGLPAFDVVLQAEAGFLHMNGEPGRPPVKMPVALIDLLAAHQLKEGILMGLLHRERTGEGCVVSTSLLESAIASLANQATNWLMGGHIPQRMGSQHPNIAPYGDVFFTRDKKPLVIAAGSERQFAALCQSLEMEELLSDERFSDNARRVQQRAVLNKVLQAGFNRLDSEECLRRLHISKVPVGRIRNMEEVFEREEAQKMVLEDVLPNGQIAKRVKTAAFDIK
jgi:crotonobetainyl-CoA:carnitine CoA-transferase CaiB-like acyl-CoA transferase